MAEHEKNRLLASDDLNDMVSYGALKCKGSEPTGTSDTIISENVEIEAIDQRKENRQKTSYTSFLLSNRNFQFFLSSYIANHAGEWMTYMASISTIEAIQLANGQSSTSGKSISRLVIVRLLPNVLLSPFGGVLADGRDRRQVMIALDLAGAIVAWLFILALHMQSIPMIYIATFLQECVAGLYEPSRSAIIPLLVPDEDDLQKATTISGLAWSVVAAFGSATGGFLVGMFGMRTCYMIDSLTYVLSALLMTMMGGKWNVATEGEGTGSWSTQVKEMIFDGVAYLRGSFFGALVFLKASGCLIFGGFDVFNVAFSERGSPEGRPFRLGLLFACVGIGCLLGPGIFDRYVDMSRPKTLQISCLVSLSILVTGGSVLIGFARDFWLVCALTVVRAAGSSGLWIYSSLLLQKFSLPGMLGRVTSLEYALALLAEAFTANMVGVMKDDYGMSIRDICLILGCVAIGILGFWFVYHFRGGGASKFSGRANVDGDTKGLLALNSAET